MSASSVLLDPTAELSPVARPLTERPTSLDGLVVGLLDISKPRGDVFLDRIHARLSERGVEVRRYAKPTFTRPAPDALAQRIATECDLVVEGLAD